MEYIRGDTHNNRQVSGATSVGNSFVSKLIPAYLEHVRVEHGRVPVTIERYRTRLTRFVEKMGDCPISEITFEKLALYKRHLMDSDLGPATIGGLLSCLRGFLRWARDVRGLKVLDAEKIKRPRIPARAVEYLTREELDRLLRAIPVQTWGGLRDRALIQMLYTSGMRISEILALN